MQKLSKGFQIRAKLGWIARGTVHDAFASCPKIRVLVPEWKLELLPRKSGLRVENKNVLLVVER